MKWSIGLGLVLIGIAGMSACKEEGGGGSGNGNVGGGPAGCSSDADCAAGDLCDSQTGQCVTPGPACTSDADCAADEWCDSGYCIPAGCTSDADCGSGEVCDTSSGACVSGGCTSDADCNSGEVCDASSGTCVASVGCMECACTLTVSEGGCADICDGNLNGTGNPNFCNSSDALSQCAACIQGTCGVDPASCF